MYAMHVQQAQLFTQYYCLFLQDFSESYRCSLLPAYSQDGRYIAAAVEYRLVIREVDSLKVVQIYSCLDKIHRIEWSANGKYVLCGLYSRGIVQVWSVEDAEWSCKIDEGPAGIKHCRWVQAAAPPHSPANGCAASLLLQPA